MSRGLDIALLDIEEGFEECFLTSEYALLSEPHFMPKYFLTEEEFAHNWESEEIS